MMNARIFRLLCALSLTLAVGCDLNDEDEGQVNVELFAADGQSALLTSQGPANLMEVVLYDLDQHERLALVDMNIADRKGRLDLPFGKNLMVFVRGFSDGPRLHFYGASAPFNLEEGAKRAIPIQLGQVDCMGLNQSTVRDRLVGGSPDMATARVGATATLLADGRVLIAGGAQVNKVGVVERVLDTLEIYDPGRGQFVTLPLSMSAPRAWHTATALKTGEVLLVGGATRAEGERLIATPTAELFVPTETGGVLRSLQSSEGAVGRYRHQAIRLNDSTGSILIAGGRRDDDSLPAEVLRFFPGEGVDAAEGAYFLTQGSLHTPRERHALTALPAGLQLAVVSGGLSPDGPTDSLEVFTINPNQAGCAEEGQAPSATNGCFFIRGRDAASGLTGRLGRPRMDHAAVAVDGGRQILFVGGYTQADRGEAVGELELLGDDLLVRAQGVGQLRYARGELSATTLHDGSVLVAGGRQGDVPMSVASRLRPRFEERAGRESVAGFDVILLNQDEATKKCDLSEPRYGHAAVRLASGLVLFVGGITGNESLTLTSKRAELFFPRVVDLATVYPD